MNRTAVIFTAATSLLALALLLGPGRPPHGPSPVPPPAAAPGSGPSDHLSLTPVGGTVHLPPVEAHAGSLVASGKLSARYVSTDGSAVLARLSLVARAPRREVRHPVNLALVIDRSGSMCGEKFRDAITGAKHLVSLLGAEDRLVVAHYGSDVAALPSVRVTPEGRVALETFIDAIPCEGGTNISAGLERAEALLAPHLEAYRSSRIILVSDGQPTEGRVGAAALGQLAGRIALRGVAVTALGVGNSFDEQVMTAIADQGAGLFGYLANSARMREVFALELQQATGVAARDVVVEIEGRSGAQVLEILGYEAERVGDALRVRLPDFRVGQRAEVLARVEAPASEVTTDRELVAMRLSLFDALDEARAAATLALFAEYTRDGSLIPRHLDAEVRVAGHRQLGAKQLEAASVAIREGRRGDALQVFSNVRAIFGASVEALDGEMSMIDRSEAALNGAASGEDLQRLSKSVRSESIKSFSRDTY